jgi:pimeloyl-ACP methyl ester carboxylesterase
VKLHAVTSAPAEMSSRAVSPSSAAAPAHAATSIHTVKRTLTLVLAALLGVVAAASVPAADDLPRRAGLKPSVERFQNVSLELGSVRDWKGQRLRTLVTVPHAAGKLPAVFVAGWLSCDSVEVSSDAKDGVSRLLIQLIEETRAIVMRMDKPGVGDSEGNCKETDFDTELSGYRAAFAALKSHARADPSRIVIVGISNGGGFSPLVAQGTRVAGYVSIGGWSKTWFEHMIELERRRLALEGRPPAAINAEMKSLAEFHAAYLFERRTPAEVAVARKHLATVWYDEPAHQYGRPAAFYHQLQSLDLSSAWAAVDAPTLVVWGEYDWIMSREDQVQIVDLVNSRAPGRARLLTVPAMDHSFSTHPNPKAAYQRMGSGEYPTAAAAEILRFVQEATR